MSTERQGRPRDNIGHPTLEYVVFPRDNESIFFQLHKIQTTTTEFTEKEFSKSNNIYIHIWTFKTNKRKLYGLN